MTTFKTIFAGTAAAALLASHATAAAAPVSGLRSGAVVEQGEGLGGAPGAAPALAVISIFALVGLVALISGDDDDEDDPVSP